MTFKPVVQNDGIFYFAYLHAIVIQHDLDFTSEYSAASREGKHPDPLLVTRSASGRPADAFPVGPALFGLPLYLVAVTIAGPDLPQFGPPYATAFCLSSLLAGLLALALCFRITAAVTGSDRSAVIGVAAAALTTPFVYYLSYEPSYSHTFSAFASAAFVYWWWRTGEVDRGSNGSCWVCWAASWA